MNYLPGLTLNHDPPDTCLLSSQETKKKGQRICWGGLKLQSSCFQLLKYQGLQVGASGALHEFLLFRFVFWWHVAGSLPFGVLLFSESNDIFKIWILLIFMYVFLRHHFVYI
jgi:hypothetical protein